MGNPGPFQRDSRACALDRSLGIVTNIVVLAGVRNRGIDLGGSGSRCGNCGRNTLLNQLLIAVFVKLVAKIACRIPLFFDALALNLFEPAAKNRVAIVSRPSAIECGSKCGKLT